VIRLAECTSREAGRLARDPRALVILPLGAVEQHGPHLPLLVDWLGAEELARHVAPHLARAGYRVVLAPALPYGASPLAETWPGTVSLSRATLRRVIVEVIGSLARHGFRRFVLANYQADPAHVRAMGEAKRALTRGDRRLRILFAGFSPEARSMAAMLDPRVLRLSRSPNPKGEWHAGELETALVLARRPDLVRQAVARRLPPVWVDFRAALRKGARRFEQIAPGGAGYFGWPAAARAATAKRALALRGRLMAGEIIRTLGRARDPADRTPLARGRARSRSGRE
jgi:creatinine amidohydrolase/Fe(II)-dependent formamide hydrolase-like protein